MSVSKARVMLSIRENHLSNINVPYFYRPVIYKVIEIAKSHYLTTVQKKKKIYLWEGHSSVGGAVSEVRYLRNT